MVIACTKVWISLYIQSHFNPLQNHSAKDIACHVKEYNVMPGFAAETKWRSLLARTRALTLYISICFIN